MESAIRRLASTVGSLLPCVLLPVIGWSPGVRAGAADAPTSVAVAPAAAAAPAQDVAQLNAFLDTFLAAQLDAHDIPGALAVVADRSGLVTARAAGYADLDTRTPLDSERHIVPIASISKLFVATAVMQQVERGRLSLDEDIDRYLDGWTLTNPYGGPVTLRHVLTHRTGLEDKFFLVALTGKPDVRPLEEQLRGTAPAFIYAAGTYSSYSNYAIAVAGDIAARKAGARSYDDYLEQTIFRPLGMTSSTGRRPMPAQLESRLAKGYVTKGDIYSPGMGGFNNRTAPAGSVVVSAEDIAHFMAMYLNHGEFRSTRLLSTRSVDQLLTRGYQPHPALSGMGLVFYEKIVDGVRGIGHGGDGDTHHTDLTLFPDQGLGLFVVYLGNKGADVRNELLRAFVRRFLEASLPPKPTIKPVAVAAAGDVTGTYRWYRNNFTTVEKIAQLSAEMTVTKLDDTRIAFASTLGNRIFTHTGAGVFTSPFDGTHLAITPSGDGSRMILRLDGYPFMTGFRLRPWETAQFFTVAGAVLTLAFAIVAVLALRPPRDPAGEQGGRSVPWPVAALALLGAAWFPAFAAIVSRYGLELYLAVPPAGYVLLLLPMLTVAGAMVLVIGTVGGVKAFRANRRSIVLSICVAVLTGLQFVELLQWNLVGLDFR